MKRFFITFFTMIAIAASTNANNLNSVRDEALMHIDHYNNLITDMTGCDGKKARRKGMEKRDEEKTRMGKEAQERNREKTQKRMGKKTPTRKKTQKRVGKAPRMEEKKRMGEKTQGLGKEKRA